MIEELFGAIPDVSSTLPDADGLVDTALTEFSNLYGLHGLHRPIILPHLAGFVDALLLLAGKAERDYGTRIPAFETLDELIVGEAKPIIGGSLMADFETFIGTIVPVLSEPSDGADVDQIGLIYSCALQVLEDVVETSEARQPILSFFDEHGDSLDVQPLSARVRVLPRVKLLPRILEPAQAPDAVVSANVLTALSHLFEQDMPRILALGSGVIDEISKLLLQAEAPPQLAPLASFAENLPASIRCDLAG
jgi:hypothetical protein